MPIVITVNFALRYSYGFVFFITGVFIMVAAGIGAGIVIVILEVLYYKHKGWRKQQQKVIKKTTEQWQEHVQERKQDRQDQTTRR